MSADAWRLALDASAKLAAGDAAGALRPLDRAVRATGDGWPLLLRARAKQALGRDRLAVADVTRAFDREPECGWIFGLPVLRLEIPDAPEARTLHRLQKGFRADRGCWPVRAFVGKLKLMHRKPEGMADLDWAVRASPRQAYLFAWRAEGRRRFGRFAGALADASRALAMDPRDDVARTTRAAILRQKGRPKDALREAARAWKCGRTYETAPLEAARACLDLADARGLLTWLARAVRRSARLGWRNLGEGGAPPGGVFETLARRTSGRKPLAALAAWNGELRLSEGDDAGAAALLRFALELDPKNAWALAWMGETLLGGSRMREAARLLDRAIRLDPKYPRARIARGRARLALGRIEAARRDFDAALAPDETWALARLWRARALSKRGREAEALADLDEALRLDEGFDEARLERARLRRRLGDRIGALADLERAEARPPSNMGQWGR